MTTIVWDGKTLAGDTLRGWGNQLELIPSKVEKLEDGSLFGGGGHSTAIQKLRNYILRDFTPTFTEEEEVTAIRITPDGKVWFWNKALEPVEYFGPYFAIGTGADYALGALYCGADAEEAVHAAMEFDKSSGGKVTSVRL